MYVYARYKIQGKLPHKPTINVRIATLVAREKYTRLRRQRYASREPLSSLYDLLWQTGNGSNFTGPPLNGRGHTFRSRALRRANAYGGVRSTNAK